MNILERKRAYRDGLRRLERLCSRNYRLFQQWPWLKRVDTMQLIATEPVGFLPAGQVELTVLHRWPYTTVLNLRSAPSATANIELQIRLYHDANSAEVTIARAVENGVEREFSLQQTTNQPKEKLYWNTFLSAWLSIMQVHIYAVPNTAKRCVNS